MPRPIKDEFTPLLVSRQRKWQLRRTRDGFCPICGQKPEKAASYCAKHADAHAEIQRKRYGFKPHQPGSAGHASIYATP